MIMIDVHTAKQQIQQHCPWIHTGADQIKWHDTQRANPEHRDTIAHAVALLEPRSLVIRHAKHHHLVRVIAASYI